MNDSKPRIPPGECGALGPPQHCSRPRGHAGEHMHGSLSDGWAASRDPLDISGTALAGDDPRLHGPNAKDWNNPPAAAKPSAPAAPDTRTMRFIPVPVKPGEPHYVSATHIVVPAPADAGPSDEALVDALEWGVQALATTSRSWPFAQERERKAAENAVKRDALLARLREYREALGDVESRLAGNLYRYSDGVATIEPMSDEAWAALKNAFARARALSWRPR
jgi:hypothetical protein